MFKPPVAGCSLLSNHPVSWFWPGANYCTESAKLRSQEAQPPCQVPYAKSPSDLGHPSQEVSQDVAADTCQMLLVNPRRAEAYVD